MNSYPVLGNDENYYPELKWTEVLEPTRNSVWALLKRDFPHVTPSWVKEHHGIDMRLPKLSTVEQLQQLYQVLQARKLNGLLLK